MRAYESLRRRGDFTRTTRRGRRRNGTYLTCFVADASGRTRVGITVSGTIAGAVERNRLRRRIKAILDGYPLGAAPWRDVVFIARPGSAALRYDALAAEVERVFGPPAPCDV